MTFFIAHFNPTGESKDVLSVSRNCRNTAYLGHLAYLPNTPKVVLLVKRKNMLNNVNFLLKPIIVSLNYALYVCK